MTLGESRHDSALKYKLNRPLFLEKLRKGMPRSSACVLAGVSYPCLKKYVAEGIRDIEAGDADTFAAALVRDIQLAEAACEETWLGKLEAHAEDKTKDWRAISWLMERRHARNWRVSKALDHVPPEGDDQAVPAGQQQDSVETLQAGLSLLIAEREARGK